MNAEDPCKEGGVTGVGRGGRGTVQNRGSLDHTPVRVEPEVTSEVLQMELEAATPLPGENVTTPPEVPATCWTPIETREEVDTSPVPNPSNSNP